MFTKGQPIYIVSKGRTKKRWKKTLASFIYNLITKLNPKDVFYSPAQNTSKSEWETLQRNALGNTIISLLNKLINCPKKKTNLYTFIRIHLVQSEDERVVHV